MSTPLTPLRPGEELIDVPSFEWIYSGAGATRSGIAQAQAQATAADAAREAARRALPPELPKTPAPARKPAPVARPAGRSADDTLVRLGVRAISVAHRYAANAAFLVVRPGGVQLLAADGLDGPRAGLLQSTERWSAFAVAVESGKALRGAPKRDAVARRVFQLLGRPDVREMGLFPALYKDRVVALLCVDHGSRRISDASFDALRALAVRIGEAFARVGS